MRQPIVCRLTDPILTALILATPPAMAADSTWTGSSLDSFWASSANWAGGVIPGSTTPVAGADTGSSDTAGFNHNLNTVVAVDSYRNLKALAFYPGVDAYTFHTGTLALSDAGSVVVNGGVTQSQAISSPVVFVPAAAGGVFTNNSLNGGVELRFTGGITGQRPATAVTSIVLNGVGQGSITSGISNSV